MYVLHLPQETREMLLNNNFIYRLHLPGGCIAPSGHRFQEVPVPQNKKYKYFSRAFRTMHLSVN